MGRNLTWTCHATPPIDKAIDVQSNAVQCIGARIESGPCTRTQVLMLAQLRCDLCSNFTGYIWRKVSLRRG